ncbi:hypothetical protein [Endozoicomonas ascidiicola]|uniref:hypothetical protein n=1 Tax=Endozoicomonas ascidiicola TaxID=1698521 RepID=UPI00082B5406|nr:hypothetical protein [Endozoicomonas ascidiicola]
MSHAIISSAVKSERDLFALLALKSDVLLAVVLALAIIQLTLNGSSVAPIVLLAGSLLSIGIMTGLDKGARRLMSGLLSHIPYVFGIYLFFFEGFVRLTGLLTDFSVLNVILVLFFFVAGNSIATAGYNTILYAKRLKQSH